jgi:carbonic anhydrase
MTSPPCTEGLRWFVAGDVLVASTAQLQDLLGVSKYSARAEQMLWQHGVN